MDIFLRYIVGLLILAGFIVYPIVFNYFWKKWTGEDPMDNNYGPIGYFIFPYVMTMGIIMLFMVPLLLTKGMM